MRERWGRSHTAGLHAEEVVFSHSAARVRWIVRRNAFCCRGAINIGVERVLLLLQRRRRRRWWWGSPRHACVNRNPRRGVAVAGVAMRAAANRYSPTAASQVRRAIVVVRLMRVVRKRRRRRGDSGGCRRHIVLSQQLSNANSLQFSSQRRHDVGRKTRGKRRWGGGLRLRLRLRRGRRGARGRRLLLRRWWGEAHWGKEVEAARRLAISRCHSHAHHWGIRIRISIGNNAVGNAATPSVTGEGGG